MRERDALDDQLNAIGRIERDLDDQLMLIEVDGARSGYKGERLIALMSDLVSRASQTTGVVAASMSENGIFSGTESGTNVRVEGFTARSDEDSSIAYDDVGPAYFATIGAQ